MVKRKNLDISDVSFLLNLIRFVIASESSNEAISEAAVEIASALKAGLRNDKPI